MAGRINMAYFVYKQKSRPHVENNKKKLMLISNYKSAKYVFVYCRGIKTHAEAI